MNAEESTPSRRRLLRGLALAPAAALGSTVTGCGPVGAPESAPAELPSDTTTTATSPSAQLASPAPAEPARPEAAELTIRWNGLDPAGQAAALDFVSDLWTGDAIRVTPDFSDWASSFDKILTGFAAGTAPDIWQGGGLWTPLLAAKGATLFVDDFVSGWDGWPDFYTAAVDDVTYEDHVHGVPYRVNLRSPVIRPSMFEAAGLESKVPGTWEELREVAPELTVRLSDKWEQAGFNQSGGSQDWDSWLLQAGPLLEPGASPPTIDREAVRAVLEQYVFLNDAVVMPIGGMDSGVPNLHPFCAGKVAIQQLWPGDLANCELNDPIVFDDSVAGEPWIGPFGEKIVPLHIDKYMAYRLTKSPAAVYTVLERLSDLDVNFAINVETRRSLPCRVAMESYAIFRDSPDAS